MAGKVLPRIVGYSVRPQETAARIEQTGLDETVITRLVTVFYDHVRSDPALGPIFEARIENWPAHLKRMVDFWSSVALMTGRYHGTPMQVHAGLPADKTHFEQWLALFRKVARQVCTPAGADFVIERAERIARSIHLGVYAHASIPQQARRSN